MTPISRLVLWAPRLLGVATCLFIGMFALDAFSEDKPLGEAVGDFAVHLIPAAVLLVIVALSWRCPWVAAALPLAGGPLCADDVQRAARLGSGHQWTAVRRRRRCSSGVGTSNGLYTKRCNSGFRTKPTAPTPVLLSRPVFVRSPAFRMTNQREPAMASASSTRVSTRTTPVALFAARHVTSLDRWLAARVQATIADAPVRLELWDGHAGRGCADDPGRRHGRPRPAGAAGPRHEP